MDGFIIIDKQKDMTSFDVVHKVKKLFNTGKVGHSGTLDPNATGVLVIAIGRATKFLPLITKNSEKTYLVEALLGKKTDTDDVTGKIIKTCSVPKIDKNDLLKVLLSFEKTYEQYPPKYSAKKINGKRMYELARAGKEFDISPSTVTIKKINLLNQDSNNNFMLECVVGKGTYIRSLIVDIANELKTCATMGELRRIKTDGFSIDQAVLIDNATINDLIDLKSFVRLNYENILINGLLIKQVSNGVIIPIDENIKYPCVFIDENSDELICMYDKDKRGARLIFKF